MAARLRNLVFDNESSDDEDNYVPVARRPRWIRERINWFEDYDEVDFRTHFRLSKESTMHLLHEIEHRLEYPSDRNASVSPINQLLAALRYYATGCSQLTVGDYVGFSKPTAHRIVRRVSTAIASLQQQHIKFPQTREEIRREQLKFYRIARFPKAVGAMDCTHIRISSPGGDNAELFRNRKRYFSLNVQAICSADLQFMDVVARWPGSTHDSHIFSNCNRRAMFEGGQYGDAIMLVDAGYANCQYLMLPLDNPITPEEHLYNESQIRSRNPVERLFGVWKRRFPVLALGFHIKLENTFPVIVATAVLHNMLQQRGEDVPPDDPALHLPAPWAQLLEEGEVVQNAGPRQVRLNDAARRALISNYFRSLL